MELVNIAISQSLPSVSWPDQPPIPASPAKLNCKKMNKFISKIPIKNIAIALAIAIFFIADRYLKTLSLNLAGEEPIKLIGQIFSFHFTANYHIAFSLPLGGIILNIFISLIIILIIIYLIHSWFKKNNIFNTIGLFSLLLGAAGNFYDRLKFGYVIDYWDLKYFTVFNLADILIILGVILVLIKFNRKIKEKSQ